MNLKWDDLRLFLAVHETGSLSGAARALKLGQPTLSRRIAELEEVVGEPLFERKNHGAALTAAGLNLLPAAQAMAEWATEAASSVSKQTHLPEGKVRIAAPPGIAHDLVVPLAAKIRQAHPQIRIEALAAVETLNLGRGEADISLRTLPPADADLVRVDEISSPMRVFVSKDYAARLPRNAALADLDWIAWAPPYHELRTNQELRALIPGFKPAFSSDDFIVQMAACKAGAGAMLLARALQHYTDIDHPDRLQELPIDLGPDAVGTLYLVCHKRRRHLPKVRLVMEFISREFAHMRKTRDAEPAFAALARGSRDT